MSFGYKIVGEDDEVVEDVVNIKTKAPTCSITVSKVSGNVLTYNVKTDREYRLDSGEIHLYVDGVSSTTTALDVNKASTNGYTSTLSFTNLGSINTLKLENLVYNGNSIELECSYRFAR